ncbi:MAG: TauD/TfdA family dioxygenase [Pseudomonadota bacterium]
MSLEIKPLSPALGASIEGIDWTQPVAAGIVDILNDALGSFHLLCLRTAPLTAADFSRLGQYFGEPKVQLLRDYRPEGNPEVSVFDSTWKQPEDKPQDLSLDRRSGWHTDDSYFAEPAWITLLQALEIPDAGGETRFCNAVKAFEDLEREQQSTYSQLRAVHSYDTMRAPARARSRTEDEIAATPDVVHPLIRTHEDTGNKAIYFNSNRTDRIEGMAREQSDALLDELHAHMTKDEYQYHHRWQIGDVLMWDNRSVTHSVNVDFPVGQSRIHQRLLLIGKAPI